MGTSHQTAQKTRTIIVQTKNSY